MKFDPITKDVFTDQGEFIKQLYCPYKMNWAALEGTDSNRRKCSNCDHFIINTEHLGDSELLKMVKQNPEVCLKIDLNQDNVKLTSNGSFGQK
ncbi:hypothetical protein MMU07_05515 [Aquiflexum sp. LQ15W]|uniref:hypothetical protein n=1 Tax=Cognataquiflexum nitidum TaxID=2922272 RepID=UPI001F12CC23|nr:hypothetical protein [Cognataquiflexum nitidum]MCH6199022.1 hypothetical protein [Cognataquiflexum nitidum]